jgi:large subunit ribosomal protein L30
MKVTWLDNKGRQHTLGDLKPGSSNRLKVTLVRSPIGLDGKQGLVAQSLGLRRIRHSVEVPDTAEHRGMIRKIRHLVTVEELS